MSTCYVQGSSTIACYPPVDFRVPFAALRPEEISIYFHSSNEVGRRTCQAHCEHCYFFNASPFAVSPQEAWRITRSLKGQGYDISNVLADSFADDALRADEGGSAFRVKDLGLSAWSSGNLLAQDGWEVRLERGWQIGYRSIVITAHDAAGTPIVFRGVTKGERVRQAVDNIVRWRSQTGKPMQVVLTFTFHTNNLTLPYLRQMARFCLERKVDVCRFNCLANFRNDRQLTSYELRREDIIKFYGYLAQLCLEFAGQPLRFAMSEDIGDAGIEQVLPWLGSEWQKPGRTQWCRAGYRLFALIKVDEELCLVGCVDRWDPPLGRVLHDGGESHIEWDEVRIEQLRMAVLDQQVYACWGGVGYDGQARGFDVVPEAQRKIFPSSRG